MDSTLKKYLSERGISFEEFAHPAVFTVEKSRTAKKDIPGLGTKCLFLKDSSGLFYLVCLPGEKRLDMKVLRQFFGVKKLFFAAHDELLEQLHVTPGSVSVFGMIYAKQVVLVLDKELWEAPLVCFHPNANTATLVVSHENLEKFVNSLSVKVHVIEL